MLKNLDFFKHIFLRVFEKIEPDKGGCFQNINILRVFEKWNPDIFQKSEISKISSSSHSKNAHIKLNGFQWVFGGWGDAPFIFLWAGWAKSPKMDPRAVYPPGWGNRYVMSSHLAAAHQNLAVVGQNSILQAHCRAGARCLQLPP